jgi:hypothetical protein
MSIAGIGCFRNWWLATRWFADTCRMNPRWQLIVEDSFVITGRGSVVVGILTGHGYNEAADVISPSGESLRIAKVWFDIPCGAINDGSRPIRYGIVLGKIDKAIPVPGTIVQAID